MDDRLPAGRRSGRERLAAWLLTGPLGHLYGFLAEVAVLWLRWVAAGARRRASDFRRRVAGAGTRGE